MRKVADIPIAAPDLEAAVVDSGKQLLYVNLVNESAVAVVDLVSYQYEGERQIDFIAGSRRDSLRP
ncbi:MAG TPA: hypothetical protein VIC29_16425 [Steroidobacteraceae bacterium]|jgi:hypothetical protein